MSKVDEYKAISSTLNDKLANLSKQIDELEQQRTKKLEEIAINRITIQNIIHHESPSLAHLSFDSIKVVLSYLAKQKHELLYCLNKHYRSYKLSTYHYKLTKAKSKDFYFNHNGFRDNLLKSVVNPSQQVALKITNNGNISDTSCLASVHSLVLKGCCNVKDLSLLGNIHYLDLTGTKGFKDISALTNVHTLILNDCAAKLNKFGSLSNLRVFQISKNDHICDLSSLINCEELIISNCRKIEHIPQLSNLRILKLSNTNVTNFDSLNTNTTKLTVLVLFNCPLPWGGKLNATALQSFSNMEEIAVCNCNSIEEIRNLNKVQKLSITAASYLQKVAIIRDSKEISITGCDSLSVIENIINVDGELSIKRLCELRTISGISNIDRLTLCSLHSLTTVEHVTGISSADLSSLSLSNFSFLIGNPLIKIELTACPSLVDISYLGFCPDVTLTKCDGVLDVSGLVGCHRVEIRNCRGVTDVSALGNVHELTIEYPYQYHVTGVSSLGKVHTLALSGLDITDADIVTLGTVNTLDISNCDNIVDVSPLVTVKKLTLQNLRCAVDVN